LQGRQAELQSLKELVAKRNDKDDAALAITGIGGIGYPHISSMIKEND
jgi:hypothetical protein